MAQKYMVTKTIRLTWEVEAWTEFGAECIAEELGEHTAVRQASVEVRQLGDIPAVVMQSCMDRDVDYYPSQWPSQRRPDR